MVLSRNEVPQGLMTFLYGQVTKIVHKWTTKNPDGSYEEKKDQGTDSGIDDIFSPANLVTSKVGFTNLHRVVLDIDVPAYLVPSTRPGHSHLYIDVQIEEKQYFKLLDRLAKVGILEKGFAAVSKVKGYSAVRLPWVAKDTEELKHMLGDPSTPKGKFQGF